MEWGYPTQNGNLHLVPFSRHLSEGRCSRFNLSGSDGALTG